MESLSSPSSRPEGRRGTGVKVWDPVVRVSHWTLVVGFALAYLSSEIWLGLHAVVGYVVATVVALRVTWGLVGTRHARFTDFVRHPRVARSYLTDLLRGRRRRYLGHNPAGGLMILALLIMLALTSVTGMILLGIDPGAGPFAGLAPLADGFGSEVFEGLHELCVNILMVLIAVHVSGVMVESLLTRENLVRAMWDGYKRDLNHDRNGI